MEDKEQRWFFTKDQLLKTPSKADGVDEAKELSYRQQTSNLIQDIGQKLQTNHFCIGTAIAYMHRFYMLHSFKTYKRSIIATSALFLACKVEEQPKKLEHIIKVAYSLINPGKQIGSQQEFEEMAEEVISHELLLLETLGFDVTIKHPHVFVVKCVQMLRASKDLGQMAFFLAHNSLLLTTMCLEYSPSVIACVCIYLACRWKGIEIPRSSDGKHWWEYIDPTVNVEILDRLSDEFLRIYDKSPSKFKRKLMSVKNKQAGGSGKAEHSEHSSETGEDTDSTDLPTCSRYLPQTLSSSSAKTVLHPSSSKMSSGISGKPSLVSLKPSSLSSSSTSRTDHSSKVDPHSSSKPQLTTRPLPVLAPLTVSDHKPSQLPSLHLTPPSPQGAGSDRKRAPSPSQQPAHKKSLSSLPPSSRSTQSQRHHQLQQQLSSLNSTNTPPLNGSNSHKRQRTGPMVASADKKVKHGHPPHQQQGHRPSSKITSRDSLGVDLTHSRLKPPSNPTTGLSSTSSSKTSAYSPISPVLAPPPPPPPPPLPSVNPPPAPPPPPP